MCRGGYQPPAWKPSIRCICETKCPLQENSEEEMNLFGVFSFAKTLYHSERSAVKSDDLPRPAAGEGLILPASLPRARGRWREAPDEVPIRRMTDEVLRSPSLCRGRRPRRPAAPVASLFEGGVSRRSPARRLTEGVSPATSTSPVQGRRTPPSLCRGRRPRRPAAPVASLFEGGTPVLPLGRRDCHPRRAVILSAASRRSRNA